MRIDWWTLGLQTVNVAVLIWLLGRFFFRPIAEIVATRQMAASKLLDDARLASTQAQAEREKVVALQETMAAEGAARLRQAAEDAQVESAAILAKTREEAGRLRAAAEAQIEHRRAQASEESMERSIRLAIDIARKLMGRLPAGAQVESFVGGLARGLNELPETTRAQIALEGPLRVKAPRPLTDKEMQDCRTALAAALGRDVEVTVETDADLIAGLELDLSHARIRNSLRADLEAIASRLTERDHDES